MKPEEVNAAAAEWSAIAARDKIAFFAADVALVDGKPSLTYTACLPEHDSLADAAWSDEAWSHVRQKCGELAAAIRDAVAPLPDGPRVPDGDREIRFLGDLQRIKAEPGDVFVLQCDGFLSDKSVSYISERFDALFPGHQVMVLDGGMKLGVVGASKDAGADALPSFAELEATCANLSRAATVLAARCAASAKMLDAAAPQSPAQARQSAVAAAQGLVYGRASAETPLTQCMTDARADGRAPLQAPAD